MSFTGKPEGISFGPTIQQPVPPAGKERPEVLPQKSSPSSPVPGAGHPATVDTSAVTTASDGKIGRLDAAKAKLSEFKGRISASLTQFSTFLKSGILKMRNATRSNFQKTETVSPVNQPQFEGVEKQTVDGALAKIKEGKFSEAYAELQTLPKSKRDAVVDAFIKSDIPTKQKGEFIQKLISDEAKENPRDLFRAGNLNQALVVKFLMSECKKNSLGLAIAKMAKKPTSNADRIQTFTKVLKNNLSSEGVAVLGHLRQSAGTTGTTFVLMRLLNAPLAQEHAKMRGGLSEAKQAQIPVSYEGQKAMMATGAAFALRDAPENERDEALKRLSMAKQRQAGGEELHGQDVRALLAESPEKFGELFAEHYGEGTLEALQELDSFLKVSTPPAQPPTTSAMASSPSSEKFNLPENTQSLEKNFEALESQPRLMELFYEHCKKQRAHENLDFLKLLNEGKRLLAMDNPPENEMKAFLEKLQEAVDPDSPINLEGITTGEGSLKQNVTEFLVNYNAETDKAELRKHMENMESEVKLSVNSDFLTPFLNKLRTEQ